MGRVLIRKSGTEQVLRVMVESEDEVLMLKLVDDINSKLLSAKQNEGCLMPKNNRSHLMKAAF